MTTTDDLGGSRAEVAPASPTPQTVKGAPGSVDRIFRWGSLLAGVSVLAIMDAVGLFLHLRALSALEASGLSVLTTSEWQPERHPSGIPAASLRS